LESLGENSWVWNLPFIDDLSIGLQIFIDELIQNPGPVGPSINFLEFIYRNPFFCFP
tara:strand:- start:375 stop:545 length:171 start_codon:yes stop_codon:yes gene_type:complete